MVPGVPAPASSPGPTLVGTADTEDPPQDVCEGILEVPVGHHVDHGVEGGVEVADPEEDGDDNIGAGTTVPTEGDGEVPAEEGHPADEESAHDDAEGDESFVLFPPGGVDAMALAEPWNRGERDLSRCKW